MTKIEWTDETWNPTRGCSRVSEGCRNCYAERIAARFSDAGKPFDGFAARGFRPSQLDGGRMESHWTGRVELIPDKLLEPLRWKKPRRVFVDSMSDLFHEKLVPLDVARVLNIIGGAPKHTFQVLTKRSKQMKAVMDAYYAVIGGERPFPNLWLGVSVEDQKTADERVPLLLQTPAAVRFVSYEPALEPVDFIRFGLMAPCIVNTRTRRQESVGTQIRPFDWLIVGGESGPGARPCDLAWIRSAVRQCKEADVPVFIKQLGARPFDRTGTSGFQCAYGPDGFIGLRLLDCKGGNPSEWPKDLRVREFPETP